MDDKKYVIEIEPSTIENCYMMTLKYYKNGTRQDSTTTHIEQKPGGLLTQNISFEDDIKRVLPDMMKKVDKDFNSKQSKEISSLQNFAYKTIEKILSNNSK
jgi:hypothetical protein